MGIDPSFGPFQTIAASASTGVGSVATPEGPLPNWTAQLATAGSTSAVTVKWRVVGRVSTAAAYATLSTGSGAGALFVSAKPVKYAAVEVTSISSTSSTAPTASAWLAGSL